MVEARDSPHGRFRIVPATVADYPIIERLAQQTWPDTFGSILSEEQINYMLHLMYRPEALAEQVKKGHVFHLLLERIEVTPRAYLKELVVRYQPVGYVSHQLDHEAGKTKIHKIYVLPDRQGRGYGKALVKFVERLALRAGQGSLRLDVNYRNGAVDFYEHLGFVKLGRYDTDIGNGYRMEDWQMEKTL